MPSTLLRILRYYFVAVRPTGYLFLNWDRTRCIDPEVVRSALHDARKRTRLVE
jgi:hypothetical protein